MSKDGIFYVLMFLAVLWFIDSVNYWLERTPVYTVPERVAKRIVL